jgi:hypothetical protein
MIFFPVLGGGGSKKLIDVMILVENHFFKGIILKNLDLKRDSMIVYNSFKFFSTLTKKIMLEMS